MARKFIIDQNSFRLGNVEMHFELKSNNSIVKGGGYWYMDDERENLYLYGKSIDFGRLTLEQLVEAKNTLTIRGGAENMTWVFSESDSLKDALESNLKF